MAIAAVDEAWERLGTAIHLLRHAALEVWKRADESGPQSDLHALGLGVYLTESKAAALLPDDHPIPDGEVESSNPRQLLEQAEKLTRNLPLDRPELADASGLVVDLCDLIREARDVGY